MRAHSPGLILAGLLLLGSTGSLQAEEPRPRSVKVEAGVQGTLEEAKSYLEANGEIVEKTLPELCRKCAVEASGNAIVDFEIIVAVGQGGKPITVTSEPVTPFTTCVSKALETVTFTDPPRHPLEVYFDVSFDRKDG